MRLVSATLATLVAASAPAAAQPCDCGPAASAVAGPAYIVVPRTTHAPQVPPVPGTGPVPRSRAVPRTVYVPRTRLGLGAAQMPRADVGASARYGAAPAYPGAAPAVLGLPPLFDHPCYTGSIGCNPYRSGPLYDY